MAAAARTGAGFAVAGLVITSGVFVAGAEAKDNLVKPNIALPYGDDPNLRDKYANERRMLGSGYNVYSKALLATNCVQGRFGNPGLSASASTYEMQLLSSADELSRELSVEASLSANIGAFAGKMSTKYNQSEKSASNKTYILIKVRVETQGLVLQDEEPKLAGTLKGEAFYKTCGDSYVSRVALGGEFIALLVAQSSSNELATSLSVSAEASYGGVSGSTEFSSKMNSLKTSQSLEVNMTRIGGNADVPAFKTGPEGVDTLTAYASSFPKSVESGQALPIGVETTTYDNLGVTASDDFAAPQFKAATAALDLVNKQALAVSRVQQAYEQFYLPDGNQHPTLREKAQAARAELAARAKSLSDWLQKCGGQFWVEAACAQDAGFASALTPPPPVPLLVMLPIDPQNRSPTKYVAPVPMLFVVRGRYCWEGASACDRGMDGVTRDGEPFIGMGPPGQRYNGAPIPVTPGVTTTVTALDSDYSDNFEWTGAGLQRLWAVFYQP